MGVLWRAPLAAQEERWKDWEAEAAEILSRFRQEATRSEAIDDFQLLHDEARDFTDPALLQRSSLARRIASDSDWGPDLEERLDLLKEARWAALLAGEVGKAAAADQIAVKALQSAGRLAEAAKFLSAAVDRYAGRPELRAPLRYQLANIQRLVGNSREALLLLDVLEQEEGPHDRWESMRALIYLECGLPDLPSAWIREHLDQTETAYLEGSVPLERLLLARERRIELAKALGDHDFVVESATSYLTADAETYAKQPRFRARMSTFLGTSRFHQQLDDPELQEGIRVLEELLDSEPLGRDLDEYAWLAIAEVQLRLGNWEQAARSLARVKSGDDSEAEAPRRSSTDRAVLAARLAVLRGAEEPELLECESRLEQALARLEKHWSQAPDRSGGVGYLHYPQRRAIAGELVRLAVHQDPDAGAEKGLRTLLRLQAQGTLVKREGAVVPSMDEIRDKLLRDRQGLLVFLPSTGNSHVFALDAGQIQHALLPSIDEIDRRKDAYQRHLLSFSQSMIGQEAESWVLEQERRLAAPLSEALLPNKIQSQLRHWDSVTIVGSDTLGHLPFEWLPSHGEDYLGLAMDVDYLPSIPLACAWASRQGCAGEPDYDFLMVGGVEPHAEVRSRWPETSPIPLTSTLKQSLAGILPSDRLRFLEGPCASKLGLIRADLNRTRVLQFLVHSIYDDSDEQPVALVLQGDGDDQGLLRYQEIRDLAAPSVVLMPSCASGVGPLRRGDPGMTDLAGAWLSAGADAVLVSRTLMTYGEVERVTESLVRTLSSGATLSRALRGARRELYAKIGAEAPFRHGLLHVVGFGNRAVWSAPRARPTAESDPRQIGAGIWLAAGAALGAVGAVFLTRSNAKNVV